MKKPKLSKKERRAADLADRETTQRAKWRAKKVKERTSKAAPTPQQDAALGTVAEPTAVRDSAERGADGLGYVYEDSFGTRLERDTLDGKWKRVGNAGADAIPLPP